jgi:hypothetical protein
MLRYGVRIFAQVCGARLTSAGEGELGVRMGIVQSENQRLAASHVSRRFDPAGVLTCGYWVFSQVLNECTPGGPISPATCVYYQEWLDF